MASRENTESDLLDFALRKLIYPNSNTYSFECGGLTPDIATLTNQEIKEYHSQFYHLDNMTAVICGMVDPQTLIKSIEAAPHLLASRGASKKADPPYILLSPLSNKPTSDNTQFVKFPSSDMDVGSIGYGWRGPPSEDIKTLTALTVLFRYFYDTPASPFAQAFVERPDPLASNVDFDVRTPIESALMVVFSGVPFKDPNSNATKSQDGMSDDDNSEGSESGDDEMNDDSDQSDSESNSSSKRDEGMDGDEPEKDLFQIGVYEALVRQVIQDFVSKGFSAKSGIQETLDRHRQKLMESLEEDPHETLASQIIPDITRFFFAPDSALKDTRATNGTPILGTRLDTFNVLNELEKEPNQFWQSLAKTWLLDPPMVQVFMTPDNQLANELSQKQVDEQKALAETLGPVGLKSLQTELDTALKENEINLPESLVAQMPPIPDASKLPFFKAEMAIVDLDRPNCPFSKAQIVETDSVFTHFRLAFNTESLPVHLRPYLVLFQELLFQTDIDIPGAKGSRLMDYKAVAIETARQLISHEAAVGFGNDVWSASWLSEVFMLYGSAELRHWDQAFVFLCRVILFSKFTKKRIISISKNLLNEITEVKRDGVCMLVAASTRIAFSKRQSRGSNDLEISVFRQEEFLKEIVQACKDGKEGEVIASLEELRAQLLMRQDDGPGFAQFAVPRSFSKSLSGRNVHEVFTEIWDKEFALYSKSIKNLRTEKTSVVKSTQLSPFPFPRVPFSMTDVDASYPADIIVPIAGLGASHLFQMVPCNVLIPHADYFPMCLLTEILSRTEGPLYSAIRGQG